MSGWEKFQREDKIKDIVNSKLEKDYWKNVFDRVQNGRFDTWDYQWVYSIWKNDGLAINASRNLVSNIGYDEQALNTYNPNSILSQIKTEKIDNLVHPTEFNFNEEADRISFEYYFGEHINVLFEQNDRLNDECKKRMKVITELKDTAEERLNLINTLNEEIKRLRSD